MPPEHLDWSGQQPPRAGPAPGGLAPAGLAEAAQARAGSAASALVVRTRRSDQTLYGGTTYRIGRDPKSDIVVADTRVSWRHAVLQVDGDRWVLEDVGSTNGTFLGLERVRRVAIVADCVVRLGDPEDGPVLRCMPQAPAAGPGAGALRERPAHAGPQAPGEAVPGPPRPAEPVRSGGPVRPAEPALPAWAAAAGPGEAPPREAAPPRQPVQWDAAWRDSVVPGERDARTPMVPKASQSAPHLAPAAAGVAAGAAARELLPSVDRRPTARLPLPAQAMRIGRDRDNDLVLPDLDVSRHHADLRKSSAGTYEIIDRGSHNGTYVNGQRVSSAVLSEADIVSIGRSTFRLAGGELRQFVDQGEVTFSAQDLVVKVGGGKVLLDHVTFPIPEKSLLAVIGPSGAASRRCSAR
jgi:ABC transport system ATP-binding/permease protein